MEEVVGFATVKAHYGRKFFPIYVLVEMVMDDDTWHLMKAHQQGDWLCGWRQESSAPFRKTR